MRVIPQRGGPSQRGEGRQSFHSPARSIREGGREEWEGGREGGREERDWERGSE